MDRYIDIHCHILPGLDDGAKDMEQAIGMLQLAWKEGTGSVIVTPHFHPSRGRAGQEKVLETLRQLQDEVSEHIPGMSIFAGNELFYSSSLADRLRDGKVLTMAGSNYILLEFSTMSELSDMRNAILEIQTLGYWPIIAHPERYMTLLDDFSKIQQLSAMGAYLQVNAGGVLGITGRGERKFVKKLIQEDMVHFVASDAHDLKVRQAGLGECAAYLEKKYGGGVAKAYLHDNPCKVLSNKMI